MSPSPFVFATEALSKMISALVQHGLLKDFLVGNSSRGTLMVSHMLFADDSLLFCGANHNQIKALKALLLCFEAASGLKVSFEKSKMVHFGNVRNTRQLVHLLGCKVYFLPLKYLDLPLGSAFKAQAIWDTMIKKIKV